MTFLTRFAPAALLAMLLVPVAFAFPGEPTPMRLDDTGLARETPSSPEDVALKELVPEGVTPEAQQRSVLLAMAPKVHMLLAEYDQAGNVTYLWLSNHSQFRPEGTPEGERPGVADSEFARIRELPQLRSLLVHHQPLTDEAFAVLEHFPDLEVFAIEYHGKHGNHGDKASAGFMKHIAGLENLRALHLKHLFQVKDTMVDQIGPYPKLQVVELDNASAGPETLAFFAKAPNIENLEMHRSTLSNEQVGQLVQALPKLQRLALKPTRGNFDQAALAEVARSDSIEVVGIHGWGRNPLDFEGGLEHLVGMEQLKIVEFPGTPRSEAINRFAEARPDVELKALRD